MLQFGSCAACILRCAVVFLTAWQLVLGHSCIAQEEKADEAATGIGEVITGLEKWQQSFRRRSKVDTE